MPCVGFPKRVHWHSQLGLENHVQLVRAKFKAQGPDGSMDLY